MFKRSTPEYDKLGDALSTAGAALSTFDTVVADLEHANTLLQEVELEETVKARAAQDRALQAVAEQDKNGRIAARIRELIGVPQAPAEPSDEPEPW